MGCNQYMKFRKILATQRRDQKKKKMIVNCPDCLKIKTIDKTNKNIQVRCSKRDGGCGSRYYIKTNTITDLKRMNMKLKYFAKKKRKER